MSVSFGRFGIVALAAVAGVTGTACESEAPAVTTSAGASAPVTAEVKVKPAVEPVVVSSSYEDGEIAYRETRYTDAALIFRAYAERRPSNVWGHYMVGMASWKAGDRATAVEAFDRALQVDSVHLKSLLNSSRVYLELGETAKALERTQLAVTVDSTSGEAVRLLARALRAAGDTDGAIDAYRRALTLDERDVWAMNNLGLLYIEDGRDGEALGPLARAVELRGSSPVFLNNLGIALERSGYHASARDVYERVIAADSTYGKAVVSLERVSALVQEGAEPGPEIRDLALQFEIQVRTWAEPDSTVTEEIR